MITVECDRVGCSATATVEIFYNRPELGSREEHAHIVMPDGWGVDSNGLDRVVNCPEHRTVAR